MAKLRANAKPEITRFKGLGEMSADALGITACLYAYSHLSFGQESQFTDTCAQHYHWLRDFALDHDGAGDIFRAVD